MDADTLQSMADAGLSRAEIAALFGMSRSQINRYLGDFGVTTSGNCKLQEVHGTGGQKATKLLPSSAAIRAASIFTLGA